MMKQSPSTFSPQSLLFLSQVRQENSKEWFEAHRDDYETGLLQPLRALVEALGNSMLQIDDLLDIRPAIGKTLSRIHRDTRFSHDKSRYRSNMWLTFKRYSKDWTDAPVYFFELFPDGWRFGLGYYRASRLTMEHFRHSLREQPEAFLAIARSLGEQFTLEGERYKRPLVKDQPEELARWYNFKSFAAIANRSDIGTLFSPELATVVAEGFRQLAPLYHYLMQIESIKRESLQQLEPFHQVR
jgi:uncharacterized protein (TIGR02453 family)